MVFLKYEKLISNRHSRQGQQMALPHNDKDSRFSKNVLPISEGAFLKFPEKPPRGVIPPCKQHTYLLINKLSKR
jgi:hypothetical protein